ncbi:MAG: hypothetical protein U0790_02840 [Isosphaeraceae bacterium]
MIDEVRRDGAAVRPGSQSASLSSRDRGWDGIVVEQGRFRPCDGGEVVYNEHVIGLVLGDRVRFGHSVDGRGYEGSYRPGDLVFCPGGRPVRWTVDEPWDGAFVMLRPEVVRQAADEIGLNPSRLDLVGEPRTRDPLVAQIAHALLAVLKESMGGERLYVESLRNALAIHLARSYSTHSQPAARTDRGLPVMKLRRAVEAIHENLEQGLAGAARRDGEG